MRQAGIAVTLLAIAWGGVLYGALQARPARLWPKVIPFFALTAWFAFWFATRAGFNPAKWSKPPDSFDAMFMALMTAAFLLEPTDLQLPPLARRASLAVTVVTVGLLIGALLPGGVHLWLVLGAITVQSAIRLATKRQWPETGPRYRPGVAITGGVIVLAAGVAVSAGAFAAGYWAAAVAPASAVPIGAHLWLEGGRRRNPA